jgi:hypothetical protein
MMQLRRSPEVFWRSRVAKSKTRKNGLQINYLNMKNIVCLLEILN